MDVDAATATASIAAIAEALSRAGDPNPGAIEEYREVQSRHDELERQRADLAEAADTIDRAIATINATCRERFRETFDRVAEAFAALYPRLVGGGMGRLDLVNADDLLDCGVEIVVQPPGKRVQVLSLLSGGEKAMAAIALIFALFTVKPSPFCLLDEVDAPLDEGNGARFNDMLKEMALASQFIVITHNKKTMEAADVLYGVTMPEPGASRLVSVKLE
jgi:chromosome segregation protein